MPLEVEVISRVERLYRTQDADMVIVPGTEGEMGVLPNHTPLLTTLKHGELSIMVGDDVVSFVVYGGVVEIRPTKVTVLADDAAQLDPEKIEAARERARELMENEPPGEARSLIAQELRKAEFAEQAYRRVSRRRGTAMRVVADDDEG